MLSKDVYIRRVSACLGAQGELEFLQRLSEEELSLLWSKLANKALQQARLSA